MNNEDRGAEEDRGVSTEPVTRLELDGENSCKRMISCLKAAVVGKPAL